MVKCPNCQHNFSLRKPIPPGIFCCDCYNEDVQATKKWKVPLTDPQEYWYFCDEHMKIFRKLHRQGYNRGLKEGQKIIDNSRHKL